MPSLVLSTDVRLTDLVAHLQPCNNPDASARAQAWNEWIAAGGTLPVRRFIRWANGTSVDDEEILQDTLFVAFLKVERGQYEDRSLPFTAFLKKIAHFKILEASRRHHRQIPLENIGEFGDAAELDRHEMEAAERWIEHAALRAALQSMKPRRRAIMLMYEAGYSTVEIAAHFAIREALVRKEKSLGLRQLRELMTSPAAERSPLMKAS